MEARASNPPPLTGSHHLLAALARARRGLIVESRALVTGLDHPRVADVFAALARHSLDGEDEPAARRAVEEVFRRAPGHPQLAALGRDLDILQARSIDGSVAELAECLADGRFDAAEEVARRILEQHPGDERARQALRDIAEERHRRGVAELTAETEAALAEGDLHRARSSLDKLRDFGVERPEFSARVLELEAEEQERRRMVVVDRVAVRIGEGDILGAILAYAEAGPEVREAARTRAPHRALSWFDTLTRGVRTRPEGIAEAVSALVEAEELLDTREGLAEQVLSSLTPYQPLLRGLPGFQKVQRRAREQIAWARRCVADEALDRAAEQLGRRDLETARRTLLEIGSRDLDDEIIQRASRLEVEIDRVQRIRNLEEDIDRVRGQERWHTAKVWLDQLLPLLPEAERAAWEARREELSGEVLRAFGPRTISVKAGRWPLQRPDFLLDRGAPFRILAPDGFMLAWPAVRGCWVFVQLLDLRTGALQKLFVLRTPDPLRYSNAFVYGDALWLAGGDACMLKVALEDGEAQHYDSLADLLPERTQAEEVLLTPGQRYVWIGEEIRGGASRERVWIVDRESRKLVREHREVGQLRIVRGPLVAMVDYGDRGVLIHDQRGARRTRLSLTSPERICDTVRFHDQWVIVTTPRGGHQETGRLVVSDEHKNQQIVSEIESFDLDAGISLGIVGQCVCLLYSDDEGQRLLMTVAHEDGEWREPSIVPVPSSASLVEDGDGQCAGIVWNEPAGLGWIPVDEVASRVDSWSDGEEEDRLPISSHLIPWPARKVDEQVETEWYAMHPSEHPRLLKRWIAQWTDDPDSLVSLYYLTQSGRDWDLPRRVAQELRRFPDHPEVRLMEAEAAARKEDWARVEEWLAPVDLRALGPHRSVSVANLWASALAYLDRHAEALEVIEKKTGGEWDDSMGALRQVCRVVLGREPGKSHWPGTRAMVRLLKALDESDRLLAAGDSEGAVGVLEDPQIQPLLERQSAARWATARLALEPTGDLDWALTVLALATFLEIEERKVQTDLPLGRLLWSGQRLEELRCSAREWLDTQWPKSSSGSVP